MSTLKKNMIMKTTIKISSRNPRVMRIGFPTLLRGST